MSLLYITIFDGTVDRFFFKSCEKHRWNKTINKTPNFVDLGFTLESIFLVYVLKIYLEGKYMLYLQQYILYFNILYFNILSPQSWKKNHNGREKGKYRYLWNNDIVKRNLDLELFHFCKTSKFRNWIII